MRFVRHILVGLMMFAAMACERRESMVTQFSREKILLKGNGSEPRSLDLHLIQTTTEHHIMMAMFVRVECTRIDIIVWIKLLNGYSVASRLKKFSKRSRDNTFSQRRRNASCNKNVFGHDI